MCLAPVFLTFACLALAFLALARLGISLRIRHGRSTRVGSRWSLGHVGRFDGWRMSVLRLARLARSFNDGWRMILHRLATLAGSHIFVVLFLHRLLLMHLFVDLLVPLGNGIDDTVLLRACASGTDIDIIDDGGRRH